MLYYTNKEIIHIKLQMCYMGVSYLHNWKGKNHKLLTVWSETPQQQLMTIIHSYNRYRFTFYINIIIDNVRNIGQCWYSANHTTTKLLTGISCVAYL